MPDTPSFHLLTDAQRECLRLAAQGYTSKQIGERLGKSFYAIDDRFERAVALLGAADRKAAVRLFVAYEAARTPDRAPQPRRTPPDRTPERMTPGPQTIGAEPNPDMLAPSSTRAEQRRYADTAVEEARHRFDPAPTPPWPEAPRRGKGTRRNDLTTTQRLILIPLIAVCIMLGFGGLAGGIDAIGRLFTALHFR